MILLVGLNLLLAIDVMPYQAVKPGEEELSHNFKIIGIVLRVVFVIPIAAINGR